MSEWKWYASMEEFLCISWFGVRSREICCLSSFFFWAKWNVQTIQNWWKSARACRIDMHKNTCMQIFYIYITTDFCFVYVLHLLVILSSFHISFFFFFVDFSERALMKRIFILFCRMSRHAPNSSHRMFLSL